MQSPLVDGVYTVSYRYPADSDVGIDGLAIVRDHHIIGSDAAGGLFRAVQHHETFAISGVLSAPPDGELITGWRAGPDGAEINFTAEPSSRSQSTMFLATLGDSRIGIQVTYVGPLPADLPIGFRAAG